MNKELKRLRACAEAQGWRVEFRKKHVVWLAPNGARVTTSCTPSDVRAVKNITADLRRAGLQ